MCLSLRSPTWHEIRADVLRDAAGLALGDARGPNRVEQRGLAVVDVTHDGDDRRARDQVLACRSLPTRPRSAPLRSCGSARRRRTAATTSRAVSMSIVELIVIIKRRSSSDLSTSLTRTSSLSARSLTVMPSASVMVRETGGSSTGACAAGRDRRFAAMPRSAAGWPLAWTVILRADHPGAAAYPPGRGGSPPAGRTGCAGSGRGPPIIAGVVPADGRADAGYAGRGAARRRPDAGRRRRGRSRRRRHDPRRLRHDGAPRLQRRCAGRRLARLFDAQPNARRHEAARSRRRLRRHRRRCR